MLVTWAEWPKYLLCLACEDETQTLSSFLTGGNTFNTFTLSSYKFLCAGKVEEFDETKIISGDHVEPGVRDTGTVDIGLLRITRPDTQNLIAENTDTTHRILTTEHHMTLWGTEWSVSSPGPRRPGDPVNQKLFRHHLSTGNLMHLSLIGPGRDLQSQQQHFRFLQELFAHHSSISFQKWFPPQCICCRQRNLVGWQIQECLYSSRCGSETDPEWGHRSPRHTPLTRRLTDGYQN